jgi:UDP-N-acetylmuramoyl-tripeptide--D-alanyl-D-alanine ligase
VQKLLLCDIARAIGADWAAGGGIGAVVTDSRQAAPGSLFVAIRGERFDGNDFVADALSNGAEAAVAERLPPGVDPGRAMVVPDAKRALIAIGGLYRSRFAIPFVGVTGSVGKTTTKEFVFAVLSAQYRTHKNEGNLNNEIGVPATLFALDESHQAAVIEMGMSGPGEIGALTRAVLPSVGIVTHIGESHIGLLGSRENILAAKLEIREGMPDGAPLFLCGDNDLLSQIEDDRLTVYRYGITNPDCALRAFDIVQRDGATQFCIQSPWGEHTAVIPTIGQHNLLDALAAFGAGCVLGVPPAAAAAALANYLPAGMRQKIVSWGGVTVVEDCYNCSPDSLRAAALTLSSYPCKGRRILVLSDMLELGGAAERLHAECGAFVARQEIDLLLACGELSEHTVSGADRAGMERCAHYADKQELAQALSRAIRPGDVVWFKASRGMRLEEVIQMLYAGGERP